MLFITSTKAQNKTNIYPKTVNQKKLSHPRSLASDNVIDKYTNK